MSRIDELLLKLAPVGVVFQRLGDVARIRNGRDYKHLAAGDVPVYGTGGIMAYVDVAAYDKPSVLIPRKGSLSKLYFVDRPFWTVDTIFYTEVSEALDPKFFFYYLLTQHLEELNQAGGVPSLTQSVLNELRVPTPPLEVQREIVRILDHFGDLEAELEAEVDARQTQYLFYRDSLLAAGGMDTPWSLLGEVASVSVGQAPGPELVVEGAPFPFINAGTGESGRALQVNTAGGAITIPSRGQGSVGVVGYQTEPFWCGPLCYRVVSSNHGLRTRFLYFYLKSIQTSIRGLQQAGGTPALNKKELVQVKVPLPAPKEQDEIVSVLDNFDSLINDRLAGIPAELAARRKQYEHYRDRLLSFEEARA